MRNAIDRELRVASHAETGSSAWTSSGALPALISKLIAGDVSAARSRAQLEADGRAQRQSHRGDSVVTHDDVVGQLMWGTWAKLVGAVNTDERSRVQQELWTSCLHRAFPKLPGDEEGRTRLARKLNYLRMVRNREAHFDTLYREAKSVNRIIGTCMSILSSIDDRLTNGWLAPAELRMNARALLSSGGRK